MGQGYDTLGSLDDAQGLSAEPYLVWLGTGGRDKGKWTQREEISVKTLPFETLTAAFDHLQVEMNSAYAT